MFRSLFLATYEHLLQLIVSFTFDILQAELFIFGCENLLHVGWVRVCMFQTGGGNDERFNPLNTKRRPLYLKTQSVPRCKHFSSRL